MTGSIAWFERMAFLAAHPVGSFFWTNRPENPAGQYGGKWEQIKDVFLLAAGNRHAVGQTGGAETHTLNASQLPKITGDVCAGAGTEGENGGGYGAFRSANGGMSLENVMQYGRPSTETSIEWPNNEAAYRCVSLSFGGGQAHNNMPPYLAAYCWQRVA